MDDILSENTILVTGVTGLLGGAVARALLQEGCRVRAMARIPERAGSLADLGAEIVEADLADLPSLERAVSDCQVVFHFAAALAGDFVSRDYFHQVNVDGTLQLAKAALSGGVKCFLHASTAWVYGYTAAPGTTESSPYRISHDLYIDTKIEAERRLQQLCQENGLPLVIIQPSEVYGPGDRTWTLGPIHYLKAGRLLLVDQGSGVIQPIYVADVVRGTLAAARRGRAGEAYLLCGPEVVTLKRYYAELARMVGSKQPSSIPWWLAVPVVSLAEGWSALVHRPPLFSRTMLRSNTMRASYDGSKAQTELGFIPQVSLEAGMAEVAAWLDSPVRR